jgi:ATPase subunit of ABC transporter with duplicated ATPase domains
VGDAKQRVAEIEDNLPDNPRHNWTVRFNFAPIDLPSSEPLRFTNLSKRYAETCLFENMSGVLRKGERAVLVAPNGTGKTTLLRILAGLMPPDAGNVTLSQSAITGYLDQEGETLNPNQLVLDSYRQVTAGNDRDLLAELHRNGLFTDASLPYKTVGDLSVGQRRKLALARIIASRANVLLLDEPTNHLDLLSLEALEAALRDFSGAMLAVSHDRWFIERVATHIWRLEDGKLSVEQVN